MGGPSIIQGILIIQLWYLVFGGVGGDRIYKNPHPLRPSVLPSTQLLLNKWTDVDELLHSCSIRAEHVMKEKNIICAGQGYPLW